MSARGLRAAAIALSFGPLAAHADVLICDFTPLNCPPATLCEPFEITINTHHGADAPFFSFYGHIIPIRAVPEDGVEATSYVTLGHGDREIITLFNGFDALHTRHYTIDRVPTVQSASGRCTSFW